jgi:phenylalanyl-tRNA synthetase beta chain
MVVKENLYFSVIKNTVIKIGGNLIKNVEFLEEYKGKQIPRGKKSLSCRITFQAEDRTLSDGEVDGIYKEVISLIQEQFEAKIR